MATSKITRRQREVLDHLSRRAAFSRETATTTASGLDENVADTLATRGVLNKRYDKDAGSIYWIREEGEQATSASIPTGFIVILTRDISTPSGRRENFFLARAPYDGKGSTFRRLLRGWMQTLGLRNKDLLGGSFSFQSILPDSPVFDGDHVIVEA